MKQKSNTLIFIRIFCYISIFFLYCSPESNINEDKCELVTCYGDMFCKDGFCISDECNNIICPEGQSCQPGPFCRNNSDDIDFDGVTALTDCDDNVAEIYPRNEERCDGIDNNCDGRIDEGDAICNNDTICCGTQGCVDINNDRNNCGECGANCGMYKICSMKNCQEAESPEITSVSPDPINLASWINLKIDGNNLIGYAKGYFVDDNGENIIDGFDLQEDNNSYITYPPVYLEPDDFSFSQVIFYLIRNDDKESNKISVKIEQPQPPLITDFSPSSLNLNESESIYIEGANFWGETIVLLAPVDNIEQTTEISVSRLDKYTIRTYSFRLLPETFTPGPYSMWVQTSSGLDSNKLSIIVNPLPPPEIYSINPNTVTKQNPISFKITGLNFWGEPLFYFASVDNPDEIFGPFSPDTIGTSEEIITNLIDLSNYSAGIYYAWIKNPDDKLSNWITFTISENN